MFCIRVSEIELSVKLMSLNVNTNERDIKYMINVFTVW